MAKDSIALASSPTLASLFAVKVAPLEQQFSARGCFFCPGEVWQCLIRFWLSQGMWRRVLLACRGLRLEMLQCTGQPPHERIILPKMSVVLRLGYPAFRVTNLGKESFLICVFRLTLC